MKNLWIVLLSAALLAPSYQRALAHDEDPSNPAAPGTTVTIAEQKDGLSIKPDMPTLLIDPNGPTTVQLNSDDEIKGCSIPSEWPEMSIKRTDTSKAIKCLQESNINAGKITFSRNEKHAVRFALLPSDSRPWVPGLVTFFSLISLTLCVFQLRNRSALATTVQHSENKAAEEVSNLRLRLSELQSRVASYSKSVARPQPAVAGAVDSQPKRSRSEPLQAFLKIAEHWCAVAKRRGSGIPFEVTKGVGQIRDAADGKYGGNSGQQLQDAAWMLAQAALECTENSDPQREDREFQSGLEQLVSAVQLVFIDPRPGDPLDPALHGQPVGVESADIPQRRGRISSVVRRGLKNRQGGVISTAAVNVYD